MFIRVKGTLSLESGVTKGQGILIKPDWPPLKGHGGLGGLSLADMQIIA